jgi:hypothetical protein
MRVKLGTAYVSCKVTPDIFKMDVRLIRDLVPPMGSFGSHRMTAMSANEPVGLRVFDGSYRIVTFCSPNPAVTTA